MSETLSPAIPDDIEALAGDMLKAAMDKSLSVATAESCTGGLLASLLTDIEGVSSTFERGFVTYSEDAKCELLGVERRLIDEHGVVSGEVAQAMAQGALAHSRADVALAVTGFAGAAGPDDEPGLVYLACATRDGPTTVSEEHFGDVGRGPVRIATLRRAVQMMDAAVDSAASEVESAT